MQQERQQQEGHVKGIDVQALPLHEEVKVEPETEQRTEDERDRRVTFEALGEFAGCPVAPAQWLRQRRSLRGTPR
jgi:hypothetical protein